MKVAVQRGLRGDMSTCCHHQSHEIGVDNEWLCNILWLFCQPIQLPPPTQQSAATMTRV